MLLLGSTLKANDKERRILVLTCSYPQPLIKFFLVFLYIWPLSLKSYALF